MIGSRQIRWMVMALCLLGFALRMAAGIVEGLNSGPGPNIDSMDIDTYAWNLAQGRGYRGPSPDVPDRDHLTAYRAPGALDRFGRGSSESLAIGTTWCASRTLWPVAGIDPAHLWDRSGRLASVRRSVCSPRPLMPSRPADIVLSTELLSEQIATSSGSLSASFSLARTVRRRSHLGVGRHRGHSARIHRSLRVPIRFFMIPLVGVWALWQFRRQRAAVIKAFDHPGTAIGLLAVLVPWWVRNYIVFHTFIPVSTMSGTGLLAGNNRLVVDPDPLPRSRGYSVWDSEIPEYHDVPCGQTCTTRSCATARLGISRSSG